MEEKKVTVLLPNGRRQNVKVTPNTTLLQILEEVCQKHGIDNELHSLKHHNKEVDLSQMFRFSGLPNNCLLEMSETERKRAVSSNVDICVQLEDGSRVQGPFSPNDNLWQVVEKLSAQAAAEYTSPVIIYMRQEIIGREQMSATSLKSLGIVDGRAMVRFINKNPEELRTQANVYVPPTVKETPKDDEDTKKARPSAKAGGGGGFAITKDVVQSLKKETSAASAAPAVDEIAEAEKDVVEERPKFDWGSGTGRAVGTSDTELAARAARERADLNMLEAELEMEEPVIKIIGERNAVLYSLDAIKRPIEDLPDSFFELTVHDLKLVLRDLKKIATGDEDAPLLTEKLREMEENKTMLNKMAIYKHCAIRVQFPDRHVLQGMFKPVDKISQVMDFVRKFLCNVDLKFHLFTIPPKTILPVDKTLLELDFVPTAVVHFALDGEEDTMSTYADHCFVKNEFLDQLTTIDGAFYAANKFRNAPRRSVSPESEENSPREYERRSPGPSTGAIPKRPR